MPDYESPYFASHAADSQTHSGTRLIPHGERTASLTFSDVFNTEPTEEAQVKAGRSFVRLLDSAYKLARNDTKSSRQRNIQQFVKSLYPFEDTHEDEEVIIAELNAVFNEDNDNLPKATAIEGRVNERVIEMAQALESVSGYEGAMDLVAKYMGDVDGRHLLSYAAYGNDPVLNIDNKLIDAAVKEHPRYSAWLERKILFESILFEFMGWGALVTEEMIRSSFFHRANYGGVGGSPIPGGVPGAIIFHIGDSLESNEVALGAHTGLRLLFPRLSQKARLVISSVAAIAPIAFYELADPFHPQKDIGDVVGSLAGILVYNLSVIVGNKYASREGRKEGDQNILKYAAKVSEEVVSKGGK